jgi:hypothetical protein
METIKETIDGQEYRFHISFESDQKNITGYIKLLNGEESFRRLENPTLILKRLLYFHLYSKFEKYLIVKSANIEENEEYQALFEIVDLSFRNNKYKETVQTDGSQNILVSIEILNSFVKCEEFIQSPFSGNARSVIDTNTRNILNLFRNIFFHVKIEEPNYYGNSHTQIMEDAIQQFKEKHFGNLFMLFETERIICSQKEVQISYTIMPNGF